MSTLSEVANELQPHEFAAIVADKLGTGDDVAAEAPAETVEEPTPVAETADSPTEEPEATPEPTPDGTYTDENGRLRGPDGKFVSAEGHESDPDAQPDPEATPTPDEWVLDVDEDVQSFLGKYDGDLNKALRGAVELQKMAGRQGSELGELRKMQADLESLRSEVQRRQEAPQVAPKPMPDYRGMIEEDPRDAAITAYDNGHWDAMGAALQAWASDDPVEARLFAMNVKHEADLMEQRALAEQAQRARADTTNVTLQQEFVKRVADVASRHPDLESMMGEIAKVSQERPLLREVLETGSPADRAAALEDLYLIAKSRTVASDTSEAVRQVQVRVSDEAREARAAAAVVAGSGSSAATDQPTRVDEFRSAFTDKLREQGLMGSETP